MKTRTMATAQTAQRLVAGLMLCFASASAHAGGRCPTGIKNSSSLAMYSMRLGHALQRAAVRTPTSLKYRVLTQRLTAAQLEAQGMSQASWQARKKANHSIRLVTFESSFSKWGDGWGHQLRNVKLTIDGPCEQVAKATASLSSQMDRLRLSPVIVMQASPNGRRATLSVTFKTTKDSDFAAVQAEINRLARP